MPPDPKIFDYTNRDYASLLASLLDTAAVKLPEWTDRSENDVGRLMLELMAQVGDTVLYYQDRIANEAFLSTAVERRSVIDLTAMLGYTLSTPAPASADLVGRVADDGTSSLEIQPGARFATEATPTVPATEFLYLPPGDTPLVVPRTGSGGTVEFRLPVTNAVRIDREVLGVSSGEANLSMPLTQRPVLLPRDPDAQEYLRIEVDPGNGFERWERHGTLLYSRSDDPHVVVRINDDDTAELRFGDATYGRIPPAGSTVRVTYLIGGGVAGNVGPNTITVAKSGVNLPVTVTNPVAASGGEDRESIEHARQRAPQVFRSLQRAVTADDYSALAENVPGVAKAVAVAPSWNYVDVYVVTASGTGPSDRLRADVLSYMQKRCTVGTLLSVRSPVFVSVDLTVEIGVAATFYRADVEHRVRAAIEALFAVDRLEFGHSFYLSKVYEAVTSQAGVEFARVTRFAGRRSDPPGEPVSGVDGLLDLRPRELANLGTVVVKSGGGLG